MDTTLLFIIVCAATALTTGLFVAAGAFVISRSINEYVRAVDKNTATAVKYEEERKQAVNYILNKRGNA